MSRGGAERRKKKLQILARCDKTAPHSKGSFSSRDMAEFIRRSEGKHKGRAPIKHPVSRGSELFFGVAESTEKSYRE